MNEISRSSRHGFRPCGTTTPFSPRCGRPSSEVSRSSSRPRPQGEALSAAPLEAGGAGGRGRQAPTLVSLIRAHLAEADAPCSAGEVTAALREAHPDRVIKTTVVRTTLEGLVAKGIARRLKQGHSVHYVVA